MEGFNIGGGINLYLSYKLLETKERKRESERERGHGPTKTGNYSIRHLSFGPLCRPLLSVHVCVHSCAGRTNKSTLARAATQQEDPPVQSAKDHVQNRRDPPLEGILRSQLQSGKFGG